MNVKINLGVALGIIGATFVSVARCETSSSLATGGVVTLLNNGTEAVHTFATAGTHTFTLSAACKVRFLAVGGGGGGGYDCSGGGGAGGMLESNDVDFAAGTYTITVGAGGAGGAKSGAMGANGGDTIITASGGAEICRVKGGGGGGAYTTNKSGAAGGSGGGATHTASGGAGTTGQGYGGGYAGTTSTTGGGGAGGRAPDRSGQNRTGPGGAGGPGKMSDITGVETYYAGGGGGGGWNCTDIAGQTNGGIGGGGNGVRNVDEATRKNRILSDGRTEYEAECSVNGLGGGGGGANNKDLKGRPGGCGTVIIRIPNVGDDTLLIGGVPNEVGSPTPAYGMTPLQAGGEQECHAPAIIPVSEGTRIVCRGWKLYDIDLATQTQTLLASGSTTNCTVTGAGGCRKLEWQWQTQYFVTVSAGNGGTVSPTSQWMDEGTNVTFVATPDALLNSSFLRWNGDVSFGRAHDNPLTLAISSPAQVGAEFFFGSGELHVWTGAADNFWDNPANWTPQTVPTERDTVMISSNVCWIRGDAYAASLEIAAGASLFFASTGTVTSALAAWPGERADRHLMVVGDLSCAGNLALGGRWGLAEGAIVTNLDVSIGGDFTLSGAARCGAYAATMTEAITWPNLYAAATRISIVGDFTIADTAILYPTADRLTGTATRFTCADFALAQGATVDAKNRGWGWITYTDASQIDPRRTKYGTYNSVSRFGLAPNAMDVGSWGGGATYACPYIYAPFGPGTQSGAYQTPSDGGGVFWLRASGTASVNGKILVDAPHGRYSAPSGGGIWIAAGRFTAGPSALLSSTGGKNSHGSGAGGSGGAISIAIGVPDAKLDALAAGASPESIGLDHIDDILVANYTVQGGYSWTDANNIEIYGRSGTATTVYGETSDISVIIQSATQEIGSPDPAYGAHSFASNSEQTFSCAGYGYDLANPRNVRYVCVGYAVSNSTAEVASGVTDTFTLDVGTRALTVNWIWGGREVRFPVSVPANAVVRVNGTSFDEDGPVWLPEATAAVFEAVPESGYEFLCWEGEVPEGLAKANPITLTAGTPRAIRPVVREIQSATSRSWKGGTGVWTDAAKWEPAGIPGFADDVTVSTGTCLVSNYFECASLSLSGAAKFKVGTTATKLLEEADLVVHGDLSLTNTATLDISATSDSRFGRLSVGGDLSLFGANTLTVCAGPISDTRTFATGAGFVNVGGDFSVLGTATVTPVSAPYTGGSVVFRVGGLFTVGHGARFYCPGKGYARVDGHVPISLCPGLGNSYTVGGGYGGTGWGANSSYGQTYGFANAPIHPGAPKGAYNNNKPGGGLVRVHAKRVKFMGTVNAMAYESSTSYGGPSGGGVWITSAGKISFGDGASVTVKGGFGTNYTSEGGGGRIAFGAGLTDGDVAELAETGELPRLKERNILGYGAFTNRYPSVSIDISCGRNTVVPPHAGTFRFLDARRKGTVVLLR